MSGPAKVRNINAGLPIGSKHRAIYLGKHGCGTNGSDLIECVVCLGEPWPCEASRAETGEKP